jgi:hypothetical protein
MSIIKQYIDGQARLLEAPGCAWRPTGWANPGLNFEARAQDFGQLTGRPTKSANRVRCR